DRAAQPRRAAQRAVRLVGAGPPLQGSARDGDGAGGVAGRAAGDSDGLELLYCQRRALPWIRHMTTTIDTPVSRRLITLEEYKSLPEGPPKFEFEKGELIPMTQATP